MKNRHERGGRSERCGEHKPLTQIHATRQAGKHGAECTHPIHDGECEAKRSGFAPTRDLYHGCKYYSQTPTNRQAATIKVLMTTRKYVPIASWWALCLASCRRPFYLYSG